MGKRALTKAKRFFEKLFEKLAFTDEADLRRYIPNANKTLLPQGLRITWLDRLVTFGTKNAVNQVIEIFQCMMVLLMLGLYILSEYIVHTAVYLVDAFVSCTYLFVMILTFLLSEQKRTHLFMPNVVLDLFTVIPTLVFIFVDCGRVLFFSGKFLLMTASWVKVFRLLRVGSVVRTFYAKRQRGVVATIFILVTSMVTLIIIFSAFITLIEMTWYPRTGKGLEFHRCIYLMIVTILTIGYGDLTPESVLGQFAICLFSIIGALIILGKGKEVLAIIQNEGEVLFSSIEIRDVTNHIIICGSGGTIEAFEFMKEFFHENHGNISTKKVVVVFSNPEDTANLRKLTGHKFFKERVKVIEDDITDFHTLQKLRAEAAHGIFVLTNSKSTNSNEQDSRTLMTVLAIKNYHKSIPLYVEYINPENARSFEDAGCTIALCLNDLKLKLITTSILVPGLTTLITNVLASNSTEEVIQSFESSSGDDPQSKWIVEYCQGCENEVYIVKFADGFLGCHFIKVVEYVYEHYDLILIAVRHDTKGFILNPGTQQKPYVISSQDRAVVLAQSHFHSAVISLCEVSSILRISEQQPPKKQSVRKKTMSFKQVAQMVLKRNRYSKYFSPTLLHNQNHIKFKQMPTPKEVFFSKDSTHLRDHFILLGHNYESAIQVVFHIRGRCVNDGFADRPIVIMVHPDDYRNDVMMENLYDKLKLIYDVTCFIGSSSRHEDLINSGIPSCFRVIFLATEKASYTNSSVDAPVIHSVLSMVSISPQKLYVAEIIHRQSIKFFKKDQVTRKPRKTSVLASLFDIGQVDSDFEVFCFTSPLFASGRVFSRSFFTKLLSQTFFTPEIIEVIENFCGFSQLKDPSDRENQMSVHLIPCDECFYGEEFRDVYTFYLQKRGIVIGIYRKSSDTFSYVVASPFARNIMEKGDQLFVIGSYEKIKEDIDPIIRTATMSARSVDGDHAPLSLRRARAISTHGEKSRNRRRSISSIRQRPRKSSLLEKYSPSLNVKLPLARQASTGTIGFKLPQETIQNFRRSSRVRNLENGNLSDGNYSDSSPSPLSYTPVKFTGVHEMEKRRYSSDSSK